MPDVEKLLFTQPTVAELTDEVVRLDKENRTLQQERSQLKFKLAYYGWHKTDAQPPTVSDGCILVAWDSRTLGYRIASWSTIADKPHRYTVWCRLQPRTHV